MTNSSRYAWSFLASLLFFTAVNVAQRVIYLCDDCHTPYGWPFTNWMSEGYVQPPRFVPVGLLADFVLAVLIGSAVGALWNWRIARRVK
jgi:hypothetical protein